MLRPLQLPVRGRARLVRLPQMPRGNATKQRPMQQRLLLRLCRWPPYPKPANRLRPRMLLTTQRLALVHVFNRMLPRVRQPCPPLQFLLLHKAMNRE